MELLLPLILFGIWTLFSVAFIRKYKYHQITEAADKKSRWNNTYIFEIIPSVFPTLGIFCTALGITIGIWNFDTADIQGSIPELLSGLRLAFVATMAGIIGLIIFQKWNAIVQKQIDDNPDRPKKQSDELSAIGELTLAVRELKKDNEKQIGNLIHSFGNELENKVSAKLSTLEQEVVNLQKSTTDSKSEIVEQLKNCGKNKKQLPKKRTTIQTRSSMP